MNRFITAAFCSVLSGNLLITLIEKALNSRRSLEELRDIIIYSENRAAAAAAYPADLLTNKMIAWVAGAFVAGLVLSVMLKNRNKWVQAIVVLFYLSAAFINIAIVPHPSWIAATIPAIFIVPFMGGLGLAGFVQEVKNISVFSGQHQQDDANRQPAL
jgi:hypothetical protein